MGNFYTDVIKKDKRFKSSDRVSDPNLLEPATRKLVQAKSWSRKSEQSDKWSFCLTAGTLRPANQERP
jgi:hypothetical protein